MERIKLILILLLFLSAILVECDKIKSIHNPSLNDFSESPNNCVASINCEPDNEIKRITPLITDTAISENRLYNIGYRSVVTDEPTHSDVLVTRRKFNHANIEHNSTSARLFVINNCFSASFNW